ncbi:hypothetical protein Scep_008753 [Stephania cephalantha]|uniref:DYW domain-containing protein n=1 Tax=Stephania cephalantha TaxID=152367 RepID=A0AAP0PCG6_9MAGN
MADIKQFHSQLIRLGLSTDNDAMGRLIKFCSVSETGDLYYALKVFEQMPHPDPFVYNTLIRGFSRAPQLAHHSALLYIQMLQQEQPLLQPNKFTFPPLVKSCCCSCCGEIGDAHVEFGRQVHAHVVKFGFCEDVFTQNSLIDMYVGWGLLVEGRRVFDEMPERDVVSWTSLVNGYSRRGLVDEAFEVFEAASERGSVGWNAMVAGFVRSGRLREAFALLERMWAEEKKLDKYAAASMLAACAGLGALEQGELIVDYLKKSGIELDGKLSTAVIDMYCKCGSVDKALEFFAGLSRRALSSWNCMIGGLAMHGQGEAAVNLFREMEREKIAPDNITLVNVLSACAHAGLVEEGKHYFHYMKEVHGVEHTMEHFGCMVDLLGRSGRLSEARKLIDEMPMSPDVGVLGALFGACKIHKEIELGEQIGRRVIELEPQNSGRYILLANLYASVGRWDDAAEVRKLMNDRGVKKAPGCSIIELDGAVSEFIAGGRTHPQSKEIYAKVDEMLECIRSEGYVPDKDTVLHDIEEDDRENPLYYHSEKLAIAFGLLKTTPGAMIRISKNLRVCKDCHQVSKLISKVYDREIIMRDRNRFHHFKKGECSCGDYW